MTARTRPGRPLRFFGLLLLAWVSARVGLNMSEIADAEMPRLFPVPTSIAALPHHVHARLTALSLPARNLRRIATRSSFNVGEQAAETDVPDRLIALGSQSRDQIGTHNAQPSTNWSVPGANLLPTASPMIFPTASTTAQRRWHASALTLWRPNGDGDTGIASVGQLGGSQAGIRLDLDLSPDAPHRIAAYVRTTTALNRPAAPEGAAGIAYQPSRRLPVTFALERRIALGTGARDAMAVMVVGGFGPTPVTGGLFAEGYGQAGVVGFHAGDGFVDGKISLLASISRTPLRVGASVSGGAQPGVHRVDIGPQVQWRLPVASASTWLSVEWRERVSGLARPVSGLAVTLAADF